MSPYTVEKALLIWYGVTCPSDLAPPAMPPEPETVKNVLMLDENTFFRTATLLICGSLDIDVALEKCWRYIRRFLPADEMAFNVYDPAIGAVRLFARAGRSGRSKTGLVLELSPQGKTSVASGARITDTLITNPEDPDPFHRRLTAAMGLENVSSLALRLRIGGRRMGVADLYAEGSHRYTAAHARLFSLLREPFALAMANALRHEETVRLKDRLARENRYLNKKLFSVGGETVVGADGGLKNVMVMARRVAPLNNTVLLLGETGVGKEVVANAIHRASPRCKGPFIKVNCGAIPETLIDSELFGHERGAFTGAVRQRRGLFERADKGTIFLDEIGELPPPAQVRLLRVLQTHDIERVGGSPSVHLDIRVLAATHRNLENLVTEGRFREDLLFRINVFPIPIPPLRQRKEDIPGLVHHFLARKAGELGQRTVPSVSSDAMASLMPYSWPGNVRELENVVERAMILQRQSEGFIRTFFLQERAPAGTLAAPVSLDAAVTRHITAVLARTNGKVNGPGGAAALLNVNPNTLRNRMDRMGIVYGRRYRRSVAEMRENKR